MLLEKAKKAKKVATGAVVGTTAFLMFIVPLTLQSVVMMGGSNNCTSRATSDIYVKTDGTNEENKKAIWSYLIQAGYSDEAAAGIMGNMSVESGFDPNRYQGDIKPSQFVKGQTGYGLVQWTYIGYQDQLFNYASQHGRPKEDLNLQLDFLCQVQMPTFKWVDDGGNRYFGSTDEFKSSKSIHATTKAFLYCFEKPSAKVKSYEEHLAERFENANAIYKEMKGQDFTTGVGGWIVWVGDSRTVGMKNSIDGENNFWVAQSGEGYKWFTEKAIYQAKHALKEGEGYTIVFNLGVNDLDNVDKYIDKLNELSEGEWSNAGQIIVLSVNPVDETKHKGVKNKQIEEFNNKMKTKLKKKIQYVDTYSQLLGHIGSDDGLHYDKNTYQKIYDTVRGQGGPTYACELDSGQGGILTAEGVSIDFDSKYYTFSPDRNKGNLNVCDDANNVAWPFARCKELSATGNFNKMICTSYAAGRYWEVNYPDDPYPLNESWDAMMFRGEAPGNGKYSQDIDKPIPQSIASYQYPDSTPANPSGHVGFIEGVDVDGSVVISECNANPNEKQYGFRVKKYKSVREWMEGYGGVKFNGFYGK